MRRVSLLFLLAALTAACTSRPTATLRKGRIISVADTIPSMRSADTVRFGRLNSGEIAELRLWITNDTPHPIAITGYERSCGCTTLYFDAQPIKPTEAQQVTLRFDSRSEQGWQLKTLDISLAGRTHPLRLMVEADVE